MKILLLCIIRFPLEVIYWFIDLLRVTKFVFSANEKVTRRCPFGCYDDGSIIQDGLRKCKSANNYYNFWLFSTLCKCAEQPKKPIPGIRAYCRERGSFEITFTRWVIIVFCTGSIILGCVAFVSLGVANKFVDTVLRDANVTTLTAVRQITKPKPIRRRPTMKPAKAAPARPIALDNTPVATNDQELLTATTHAFIAPESPAVMHRIARGYIAIGLEVKGMQALNLCRKATPDYAPAALTAAIYACQDAKPALAQEIIQKFPETETPLAEIIIADAFIAYCKGSTDDAKTSLNSLDEATQKRPAANLLGALLEPTATTANQLRELAKAFPDLPAYLKQILLSGTPEFVEEKCRAIAIAPDTPGHLPGVAARYLWTLGHRNQAATAATTIINVTPTDLDAQWVSASVFLNGGAADRAASIANAAIAMAPRPAHATDLMRLHAQALQAADRYDAAIAAWEVLLRHQPDEAATEAIREIRKQSNGKP